MTHSDWREKRLRGDLLRPHIATEYCSRVEEICKGGAFGGHFGVDSAWLHDIVGNFHHTPSKDASVIDQNVELTKTFDYHLDQALNLGEVGLVGPESRKADSIALKFPDDRFSLVGRGQIADGDVGAGVGKSACCRCADVPQAAGDHGNFDGLPLDILAEEVPHQVSYEVTVLLKCEVSGVEQVKLQILQVPLIRLGPRGREDLIILSPDDER